LNAKEITCESGQIHSDRFRKVAITAVYKDTLNTLKVLARFQDGIVDEICIVVDAATQYELRNIEKVAEKNTIPIHLIINKERSGVGNAIRLGLEYALKSKYDVAVLIAGNNKDDPKEIPRLLKPIIDEDYDYVQGSRFLPGGRHVRNPIFRGVFSRLFPFIWTLFTGVRCSDVTNGFRAYKLSIFSNRRIDIWQDWLSGYELEYYIHYKVLTLGYRMREVPVSKVYTHRHKGGYSRISPFRDWWQIVGPLISLKFGARK
jgi:dolichol-phosphate mannosyltransferase